MSYGDLAQIYDILMGDIDYLQWADYLEAQMEKFNVPGKVLLDLGCGTGSISLLLAQKGFEVIAIDRSIEMLAQAEQKFRGENHKAIFYKQDIKEFILDKEVDSVIATFDTLNYVLEPADLKKVFKNITKVLRQDGILIFDINTVYKLSQVLGNEIYTYNTDEIVYIWENNYDELTKLCQMDLTFFLREEGTGKYLRFTEEHRQRAYDEAEIKNLLLPSGLQLLGTFGELSFDSPKPQEEKIFFVARKV